MARSHSSSSRFRHHSRHGNPYRAGSSQQQSFSEVPGLRGQRSVFDRSCTHKTTFGSSHQNDDKTWTDDPSMLIPVYIDEVLPGDTFSMDATALLRMATPICPIMDGLHLDLHAFFVPNRILWEDWTKFLGSQDKPNDQLPAALPTLKTPQNFKRFSGDLYDYFGIPPETPFSTFILLNSLPFRAYDMIWNYWFRDENLQDSIDETIAAEPDYRQYSLKPRGKRKDYFTSCLPWAQKGGDVSIPLVDNKAYTQPGFLSIKDTQVGNADKRYNVNTDGTMDDNNDFMRASGADRGVLIDKFYGNVDSQLEVDLSVQGSYVNDLREAVQVQKFLERNARGGTRYNELLLAHFGVSVPDSRIQFPEYLGGGTIPVGIQQVPQTSSTDQVSPLGNLAAYSLNLGSMRFHRSFVEHGYILVLASIRQEYTYSQGINRLFLRQNRFDFFWPEFSHLGEQPVYKAELSVSAQVDDPRGTFGFQERYGEYRFNPNRASGLMRPQVPDTLAFWHLGQWFDDKDGVPTSLSAGFIEEAPAVGRILAVPSQPHFLADFYFNIKCVRPMSVYSAPGLMDHF
ncbi:major capsid protein [robinz microvirus RP_144]|nr:major capsid protein [robinz microvirus RP_144]